METRYRVEQADGTGFGKPLPLAEAMKVAETRAKRLGDGDTLRLRKVLYELPPELPPTTSAYTGPILRVYRLVVERFPGVGWAGGFVCRWASGQSPGTITQHAIRTTKLPNAFNGIDWTASQEAEAEGSAAIVEYLAELAQWSVAKAKDGDLPISEAIWRDRKWNASTGRWSAYTGPFHAAHVHESGYPYIDRPAQCLTG